MYLCFIYLLSFDFILFILAYTFLSKVLWMFHEASVPLDDIYDEYSSIYKVMQRMYNFPKKKFT